MEGEWTPLARRISAAILPGVVRDLTSRELAENLAIYAPGARALDDQLQV